MKNMSLKIKLTLKYTGCTFSVACVALILASVASGNDASAVGKAAMIVLPLVLIGSFLAGYFLVQELLKEVDEVAESAAEICRSGDFSRRLDVDEIDETDEELITFLYTLNSILDETEAAVRKESDFAEDVAKELWMPVSVILTRSSWCLDDWRLSERQRWQIELIQKKAQIVSDLLQEITFLAKADQGFQPADKKRLNISDLTKRTVEELTEQFKKTNRTIQIECDVEPEIYAEVDESCYTRMLFNLLENSVEYGRERILIKVVVERAGNDFICKVADAGIGISETDLPRVWERFYRGDPLRASEGHFGLGLSVVQWIAQVHGGWTEAESILGSGSCFTVGMPCEPKPGEKDEKDEEMEGLAETIEEEPAETTESLTGELIEEPEESMEEQEPEGLKKTAEQQMSEEPAETMTEEPAERRNAANVKEQVEDSVKTPVKEQEQTLDEKSDESLDETLAMPVITDEQLKAGIKTENEKEPEEVAGQENVESITEESEPEEEKVSQISKIKLYFSGIRKKLQKEKEDL